MFAQLTAAGLHPFRNVKDYDDWLSRVHDYVAWVDQAIVNMRAGVNKGLVQPRVLMEKVLPQLAALTGTDPTTSIYYRPIAGMPKDIGAADRTRIEQAFSKAIKEEIWPANQRLIAYIRDEYLPRTRATVGLSALPMGDRWYAYLARRFTTTNETPDEIHQIGLAEVARIRGEMDKVIAETGFKGDFPAFLAMLHSDPRFYYSKPEEELDGLPRAQGSGADRGHRSSSTSRRKRISKCAPWKPSAKNRRHQRPISRRLRMARARACSTSIPMTSRAGRATRCSRSFCTKPCPGITTSSPFNRKSARSRGSVALVSTALTSKAGASIPNRSGYEMGFYTDPYDHFGALSAEVWRAARLVLDTGLHAQRLDARARHRISVGEYGDRSERCGG